MRRPRALGSYDIPASTRIVSLVPVRPTDVARPVVVSIFTRRSGAASRRATPKSVPSGANARPETSRAVLPIGPTSVRRAVARSMFSNDWREPLQADKMPSAGLYARSPSDVPRNDLGPIVFSAAELGSTSIRYEAVKRYILPSGVIARP